MVCRLNSTSLETSWFSLVICHIKLFTHFEAVEMSPFALTILGVLSNSSQDKLDLVLY